MTEKTEGNKEQKSLLRVCVDLQNPHRLVASRRSRRVPVARPVKQRAGNNTRFAQEDTKKEPNPLTPFPYKEGGTEKRRFPEERQNSIDGDSVMPGVFRCASGCGVGGSRFGALLRPQAVGGFGVR